MKFIQSFWSCNHTDLTRFKAGWAAPEYNLMSWALSCLQLRQYYDEVVLYADTVSAKMLIDTLRLPYTEVVCNLDTLNHYPTELWALPKIHTYSQQETPFLHIDGDVYIWQPFDESLLKGGLIAQNVEVATTYYENIMAGLERELQFFPSEITEERRKKNPVHAYNAGIFGGAHVSFFKTYTQKATEFINQNLPYLSHINITNFNIFFEQYLFLLLC